MEITKDDISILLPEVKVIGNKLTGGQKTVFQVLINNKKNALKFIIHNNDENNEDEISEEDTSEEDTRCYREVETLRLCNSPYLIRLGEIPLTYKEYKNQKILYYSEEWIDGYNLLEYIKLNGGTLDEQVVVKLGIDLSYAIEELWKYNKVHRDIKPKNIMYDQCNNRFVLLDMGMVYDSEYSTLTKFGFLPGTMGYYSPEQFDYTKKKDLDFRSDLFCLGVVMYEAITGQHPFKKRSSTKEMVFNNILHGQYIPIRQMVENVSDEFENIIYRLLRKRPSERYNSVSNFRKKLLEFNKEGK